MARSLNIVIGANIEKLRQGFNDAISVIKKAGGEMSADVAKSAKSIEEKLASIATRNPTMSTVKQLTQLAMEARALGPEFAASADQFIKEAGRIKDSIGDARAEVGYFASDTRRLDAVLGGVQAVAGAFGAVEGALALAGVENEDLQKTMVKLQGAIALVNGVQAIQNALQAESAVRIGITTAATKLYTLVTGGATGATLAFRTALMSIGIGVAIAGIGALIANFDKLKNAIFPADAALKGLNTTLDKTIAKNDRDIKVMEAKGNKLGAFALQEQNLNLTLQKARANFGKNNKENWGKIIEAEILKQNQDAYNKRLEKFRKYKAQRHLEAEKARNELKATEIETVASGPRQGIKTIDPAPIDIKAPQKLEHTFVKIDYAMQNQIAKQEEYEASFAKTMEGVNQAFNSLTAQGLEDFGNMIGDLMTGQISSFDDFGKSLLASVAKFMRAFGSALIATATASKAFKELLIKDPILAAAAGVALVAGSAVITGMLNKGPQPTAFADGGIVSGPTLGLVGEYPGASSNPEVIAPLDKLKGMLKGMGNEGGYVASTTISGRDLALVIERYNKDSKRG